MALGELLLTFHVDLCKACGLIGGRLLDEEDQVWRTALDYMIAINPGQEDPTCVFPHVTAVAAAYGDPTERYMRYIKGQSRAKEAYYFFNRP